MIYQALCTSAKKEFIQGVHLPSHTYKIALYTNEATLNAALSAYTPNGEVKGMGYTAGGVVLEGYTVASAGQTAWLDWTKDPSWPVSTITARAALIYNASLPKKNAICVLDFGDDKHSSNGAFNILLPPPGETTSLIRIL